MKDFTVATYNAGDKGTPPDADIVAIQERPPKKRIEEALPNHKVYYPRNSDLAFAYNGRLKNVKHWMRFSHRSGRWYGVPGTTPARWIMYISGTIDGQKVLFQHAHLVNNAFGPVKRGERKLRLKLWWKGWSQMAAQAAKARKAGRKIFKIGDFNRRAQFWKNETKRSIGKGYDRIQYPKGVRLRNYWRGDRNGSDHLPIIARFTFEEK